MSGGPRALAAFRVGAMCELLGLSSDAPATVNFSLSQLAAHGVPAGTLHDGWGVGYYEGLDVRLIKDAAPIAESDWVPFIARHDLRSTMVVAHTRRATRGTRSYSNAQPFVRELAGRIHLFAHNGDLPGIFESKAFALGRYNPVGDTDSERAFCSLLDRVAASWARRDAPPPLRDRLFVVSKFASELRELGPANFLYCDGEVLFAHGHRRRRADTGKIEPPGLVMLQRRCGGEAGFSASGIAVGGGPRVVTLLASVPLTGEAWTPLAEGELVAISEGRLLARERPSRHPIVPASTAAPLMGDQEPMSIYPPEPPIRTTST